MKNLKAFTLIELLVVIAIIAILAAILFPVFAQAKLAAKKTADLSNVKQLGLGVVLYSNDFDDSAPFRRGGVLGTTSAVNWKDMILPYIKSGGRPGTQMYNTPGNGGVFQSPLHANAWSAGGISPFGAGDETTRFPRSYSINNIAGSNEFGGDNRFWPAFANDAGGGGVMTTLQQPASTIMLVPSKYQWGDVGYYTLFHMNCNGNGDWTGDPDYSRKDNTGCVLTDGSGGTNFSFFDSHAKHAKVRQAFANDLWDGTPGDWANQLTPFTTYYQ